MPRQNVQKFNEPILAPDFLKTDGTTLGGGGAETTGTPTVSDSNVTALESAAAVQKIRYTFNVSDGAWTASGDNGNANLGNLGRAALVLGSVGNLLLTKKGNLLGSTQIDLGIGTSANADATMSTTEDIICEKLDFNEVTTSLAMVWTSGCQTTRTGTHLLAGDDDIWLNLYGNIGADATYDLTGTVDIFFVDLG